MGKISSSKLRFIIQIEILEAINTLNEILTEYGKDIDVVWLRTLDVRVSISLPDLFSGNPGGGERDWVEAVEKCESVLRKYKMPLAGMALAVAGEEAMAQIGEARCS
jgi:4-hydroxy-2-oxoheptanedioate aldolase